MKVKRVVSAFSLVEVVLALGVVSFAFVSVVGLMPVGLKTFRQAVDTGVRGQLSQKITAEAQRSRFSDLTAGDFSKLNFPKYYDEQGKSVASAAAPDRIYTVDMISAPVRVTLPGSSVPNTNILQLNFSIKKISDPASTSCFSVIVANTGV